MEQLAGRLGIYKVLAGIGWKGCNDVIIKDG